MPLVCTFLRDHISRACVISSHNRHLIILHVSSHLVHSYSYFTHPQPTLCQYLETIVSARKLETQPFCFGFQPLEIRRGITCMPCFLLNGLSRNAKAKTQESIATDSLFLAQLLRYALVLLCTAVFMMVNVEIVVYYAEYWCIE